MNDTEMSEAIRALRRASASPAFTREVMRKIRWRERRTPVLWRLAAAVAMFAFLAVAAQVAFTHRAHQRRIEALRAEQQRIEAELNAVKEMADEAEPVVVLENDRGTRVIVDLDSAIRPASLRTYD